MWQASCFASCAGSHWNVMRGLDPRISFNALDEKAGSSPAMTKLSHHART
jgi:hypothetical protein